MSANINGITNAMCDIHTEDVLRNYAEEVTETIVIRTYDERGNSSDTRVLSTTLQQAALSMAIYGALLAIRGGYATIQAAADVAEIIAGIQNPDVNCYDSVYTPIKAYKWEVEA